MTLTRRQANLVLVAGGLLAMVWFWFGLPPLPAAAEYVVRDGDSVGSYTTWGFYGAIASAIIAAVGLLGVLATVGD